MIVELCGTQAPNRRRRGMQFNARGRRSGFCAVYHFSVVRTCVHVQQLPKRHLYALLCLARIVQD